MKKRKESIQTLATNFIERKDNVSFSYLIERLKPGLITFIRKYISDPDIINEVLSQSFISMWSKIDQYNPTYNFSTWAYAIAKNEALGQIRISNKTISHETLTENHSKKLKMYSPVEEFQEEVMIPTGEDLITKLYDASLHAIYNLSEPYKTVMIEREVNKKQLQAIADELGWNPSTVKTRLRKARKVIAESVKKSYPELVDAYEDNIR